MEHTPSTAIEWQPSGEEHFTGRVRFGVLSRPRSEGALNALGVLFEPGSRSDWHSHPDGQVLYIASGAGVVQTEAGETVEMSSGDVVYAPPGEVHWHGALPHSHMVQLSLTTGGVTEWTSRKVTEEEYRRR
ncbi:MAG TPA: cupin domain-containing protein [Acidimicrobiia bacterium]